MKYIAKIDGHEHTITVDDTPTFARRCAIIHDARVLSSTVTFSLIEPGCIRIMFKIRNRKTQKLQSRSFEVFYTAEPA